VLCRFKVFSSPEELRDQRWQLLASSQSCIEHAGWHFSFLTATHDVSEKLANYPHQETIIQSRRRENVVNLISSRQGFHDHLNAGSVWAVIDPESFDCERLRQLIARFPDLSAPGEPDDEAAINRAIRHSVRQIYVQERQKLLRWYGWGELRGELVRRLRNRVSRTMQRI
jgi:hypothetical protein